MVGDHTDFFKTGASLATSRISDQLPIGMNGNVEDGHWHNVLVSWSATDHILTYWFDGKQSGVLNQDVVANYLGGSQFAYLGFTAGTSSAHNLQEVHLNSLTARFEGQSHSVPTATPAQTQLVIETNKAGGKNNTLSRPIGGSGNDNFLFDPGIPFGRHTTLGFSENSSDTGGILSVNEGTHIAKIARLGNYMATSFVATADGHGGTLNTEAAQTANQLAPLTTPHTG